MVEIGVFRNIKGDNILPGGGGGLARMALCF